MPNTRAGGQETGLTVNQRPELHCVHLNESSIYLPTQDKVWKQEARCVYFLLLYNKLLQTQCFKTILIS